MDGKQMQRNDEQRDHRTPRRNRSIVLISALLGILSMAFVAMGGGDLLLKIHRGIDTFGKVYREIAMNYVDEIDPERFVRSGIDGMLKSLDPYTVYIDDTERDEIDLVTTGKYGGVGVTIGIRDGMVMIVGLLEGFSAAKQGIQVGDRILEIDGTAVSGSNYERIRLLVRGAPGTEVRMKIERESQAHPLEYVLIREEIPVTNVTYVGYVGAGVGYVKLERFSKTAGEDVRSGIRQLMGDGQLRALILDLRDNPGGLLDMAVDVASKIVPESSLVVSTRGRKGSRELKYYSYEKPILGDLPIALLVNGASASASEIVAGAVQDLDRGIVLGTRTFGKGLVQTVTRISDRGSLKITTARYYTPSGRSIQEINYAEDQDLSPIELSASDSNKVFRTAHNRQVYGESGIWPDSTVEENQLSGLVRELQRKAMFFRFANRFKAQRGSIADNFRVTDEILGEFIEFLKEREFAYDAQLSSRLTALKREAIKEGFGSRVVQRLEEAAELARNERDTLLMNQRDELRRALTIEILGVMKGRKAQIEATFPYDPQLQAAIGLLRSPATYTQLLKEKTRP